LKQKLLKLQVQQFGTQDLLLYILVVPTTKHGGALSVQRLLLVLMAVPRGDVLNVIVSPFVNTAGLGIHADSARVNKGL